MVLSLAAALVSICAYPDDATSETLCQPADDPCIVDHHVTITKDDAAALDLGRRALHIVKGGRLFLPDGGDIGCGTLVVSTGDAIAIDARGRLEDGTYGADVHIDVRRSCSLDAAVYCTRDSVCDLNACDSFACSNDPSRRCSDDGDCTAGTCDLRVCHGRIDGQLRQCSSDADCFLGTCSVGDGSVHFDGAYTSRGVVGGSLAIAAAGSVEMLRKIDLDTALSYGEGANLDVTTGDGDVVVTGTMSADFGDNEHGGTIDLDAQGSLYVDGKITKNSVAGLNTFGGDVWLTARDDVRASGAIKARSEGGGGDGGYVSIIAGRDLSITALHVNTDAGAARVLSDTDPGSGGPQSYEAGQTLTVDRSARFRSFGGGIYGEGGEITFDAGASMEFAGRAEASGLAPGAGGGAVELCSAGRLSVGRRARLLARGPGRSGGGAVTVSADGDLWIEGRTQSQVLSVTAGQLLTIHGRLKTQAHAYCRIDACRATLEPGSSISCRDATLAVRVERGLDLARKARLSAPGEDGGIEITMPSAVTPLALDGHVSPIPSVLVDPALSLCLMP